MKINKPALLILLSCWVPAWTQTAIPPADTASIEVELSYVDRASPYGWSCLPNYPYSFFDSAPESLTIPPPGDRIHYGEVVFLDSVRFMFAIVMPTGRETRAVFYLDSNRNGDFTDDTPSSIPGTGTNGTAACCRLRFPGLTEGVSPTGSGSGHHSIWELLQPSG